MDGRSTGVARGRSWSRSRHLGFVALVVVLVSAALDVFPPAVAPPSVHAARRRPPPAPQDRCLAAGPATVRVERDRRLPRVEGIAVVPEPLGVHHDPIGGDLRDGVADAVEVLEG